MRPPAPGAAPLGTAHSCRGILSSTHLAREGRMTVTIGRRELLAALGGAASLFFCVNAGAQEGYYAHAKLACANRRRHAPDCGTDPKKTLGASTSMAVRVEVKKNPNVPP